ncbi:putative monovalent cation/H+ antiporter subunit D [compost metagenome]
MRRYECIPIVALLGLCIALSVRAEPLLRYTQDTAASLQDPEQYVSAVLGTRPIPGPTNQGVSAQVQP